MENLLKNGLVSELDFTEARKTEGGIKSLVKLVILVGGAAYGAGYAAGEFVYNITHQR
ncbi:class IIb bacteriocin, lactobin A/cerein 7B family [Sphingobacterium psychroaquaticum]|uniref:Class IIb bacteriocin, lactobin A/cerein 7B family n=1 Tax=Sphingobacterium psychroaquaticum TaxID=561061 RepID=A0A1X7L1J6_9SPHI|nr:class IIb bacteriocin, lactobin A/cerein 7B family [Sphingobacterium psychroaquaticum]SMG47293.1 hypothetical protein SAMN05660862_3404 [Sphingobacterium psychroaquaticum]